MSLRVVAVHGRVQTDAIGLKIITYHISIWHGLCKSRNLSVAGTIASNPFVSAAWFLTF